MNDRTRLRAILDDLRAVDEPPGPGSVDYIPPPLSPEVEAWLLAVCAMPSEAQQRVLDTLDGTSTVGTDGHPIPDGISRTELAGIIRMMSTLAASQSMERKPYIEGQA